MTLSMDVRASLEALIVEHAWRLDHGEAVSLGDLYVEDGRLLGIGEDLVGRGAIAAWAARRALLVDRLSRHVCTNLRFVPDGPDDVRGTTLVTLYRHDGPAPGRAVPLLVGDYEDIIVREGGRWLFRERCFVSIFAG